MKQLIFTLFIVLITGTVFAQDDLYLDLKKKPRADTTYRYDDLKYVQNNLYQYHKERQLGWYLTSAAIVTGIGSTFINTETEINPVLVISGLLSVASFAVFWDSDKWLKRGSMYVGPTGVRISF